VLQPLTGTRSSGAILAKSKAGAGDITIPKNSFALPVMESAAGNKQLEPNAPIRTTTDTVVTEAGVQVPVTSVLGGERHNWDDGTEVRWDPPLTNIEATATVDGDMTGGQNATESPGYVKEVLAFETLDTDRAKALFNTGVGPTPALVLAWESSPPSELVAPQRALQEDRWKLYAVVESTGDGLTNIDTALDILDMARAWLLDRRGADGYVFSGPGGVQVGDRRLLSRADSHLVYVMSLTTTVGVRRTDHRKVGTDYTQWLKTQIDVDTATDPPLPVVDEAVYEMT
jgi:hypothetical protein